MSRQRSKLLKSGSSRRVRQMFTNGLGKFSFKNGDTYVGEYRFYFEPISLVKHGAGRYATDNFDIYDGEWDNDGFTDSEFHIKYNNDAQFRGRIDSNGMFSGLGSYIFPDGSSIKADWKDNKPLFNTIYREPLGFPWVVDEAFENMISFSPGNHFWDDMFSVEITHSRDTEDAGE